MTPSHQAHATAPHPQTRSRRAHARAGGLIAAALLTALFGSVVGWFVWKGQNSAPRDPTPTPGAAEIPDAAVLPSQPGTAQLGSLGENAGPFMQFADRKDPTRVAGEIVADRAQPLDGRRYRLDRPRAWNFLRDGRTLYIEADTGRASFAEQGAKGRPEEATLVGHVVLKLFAGRPDGSRPDPAKDPAIYTATMDELRFDSALGRVTVPSPLHVEGEAVAFRGKGVTLLFSELTERIEHLRVDQTEFIEFRSPSRGTRVTEATPPALPILNPSLFAASLAFAQVTPQPAAEVEYQLTATDSVRLAQGTRSVAGQRLDGWIRLVDNQLPDRTRSRMPNPSAPPRQPTPDTPRPAADLPAAPPGEPAPSTEPAPAPVPTTASGQDPVRLTFDGPLEASPLKQPSAELAHNDAFVRITAPNTGGVVASDAKSGAEASGTLIEYGATREDVAIGAAEPFGVTLSLPGTGVLVGQRIEFSQLSGSAQVRGPGMLAQGDPLLLPPDESERSIRWSQSGEFTFNQAQSGNSRQLVRALLVGDVRGEDKGGSFGAEQLQAEFTPVEGSSSRLTRTLLAGHARAGTGDDASLEAETIDVKFAQGDRPSDATPKRLLAMGNVKGRRGEDRLSAHELTADLAKLADGSVGATQVSAIGDASYFGPNDIVAKADRIEADPVAKVADLSGPNTTITRGESVITGSHIRLLSDSRRLQVLTPGTFAHRQPGTDGGPDAVARVSWWRSMTFDDLRGEVECLGSAHAELLRGENAKDTMDAERVVLLLAPKPGLLGIASTQREVSRVDAYGTDASALPVKIEVRRYAEPAGTPDRKLEQLLYLEGGHVIADVAASTLEVPVAGKLLTVDRRGSAPPNADSTVSDDARGDALFRWTGRLLMDRARGEITMSDTVRLDHRRLSDGTRVELECNQLTARVRAQGAIEDQSGSGQLERAVAQGRVWMRAQGRELTAGEVAYDAPASLVTASGEPGQTVSLIDLKSGSPFSAKWLSWNIATDRFEALQTQPIIVPR